MDRQQEFVLRTIEERDIRFVRLWFTDVLGFLKSVSVAPAELEGAFAEGIGFDGSAIEGFARIYEADMLAKPDPSTFQVLPWRGERPGTARMFCDIAMPDGTPSWADSRHVLRRQLNKAADLGFSCYVHPEIEFFLLKPGPDDGTPPVPADNGGYFDQAVHDSAPNFRRHAIDALESMGINLDDVRREVIDIIGHGQRLVDGLDVVAPRIARIVDRRLVAIDEDLARIHPVGARKAFDQRRLAGAIVAEKPDHLARKQIDGDVVDSLDAAEGDRDVAHLHKRRAGTIDRVGHGQSPVRLR